MPNRQEYRAFAQHASGGFWRGHPTVAVGAPATYIEIGREPFKSDNQQSKRFEGYHIYRPDATDEADHYRRVKVPGGYLPTSGRLVPDLRYETGVTTAEWVEVSGVFGAEDMNRLVNAGLKKCLMEEEFSFVPENDSERIDLTARAPWLRSVADVKKVGWIGVNEARTRRDPYRWAIRGDLEKIGTRIFFKPGYLSTDMRVYVLATVPAYNRCRADEYGAFGEQDGLDTDAAESPAPVEWVGYAALVAAWDEYSQVMDATANQRIVRTRAEAAQKFYEHDLNEYQPTQRELRPRLRLWGPAR